MRSTRIGAAAALATGLMAVAACGAENAGGSQADGGAYPPDTVTVLVPYAAGGPTDRLSRVTAAALEKEMGGTFVVENKEGGGGTLAVNDLLSGPTDGSSLAVIATPSALIPPALGQADYSVDDFSAVGLIAEQPIAIVTGTESGISTADEFIAAAKANPGEVTVGTNGPTTAAGIGVSRLSEEHDLPIQQVPFDGQAELTSNLLGGNLSSIIVNTNPEALKRIESGEFVPLAVFSPERLEYLPDVPTLAELGFEDITLATSRFGLVGPSEMPADVRDKLATALETVLSDSQVASELGENYVADDFISGEEWQEDMRRASEVYAKVLAGQG